MKHKDIPKIVILLFILLGMLFINRYYEDKNIINLNNNETVMPKTTKFSISMWVKPKDNSFHNYVIKLSDDKSQVYVVNNDEDENYISTGICILNGDNKIYKDNSNKLDVGIFSNIVLVVNGRNITVYLDGKSVIEGKLTTMLSSGKILLKIFDEFEISDIGYYNRALRDDEVLYDFEKEIDNKFNALLFDDVYSFEGGTFPIKTVPEYIEYISNSDDLSIDNSIISIKSNDKTKDIDHNVLINIKLNDKVYSKKTIIKQQAKTDENIFKNKVNQVKNIFNYYMSTSNLIENVDETEITCKVIEGNAVYDNQNRRFIKTANA